MSKYELARRVNVLKLLSCAVNHIDSSYALILGYNLHHHHLRIASPFNHMMTELTNGSAPCQVFCISHSPR